jgi:outer membrane protein assembly factor BamB
MKKSLILNMIPVGLALVGAGALYLWLSGDAAVEMELRLPKPEAEEVSGGEQGLPIEGELATFDGKAADWDGAWPRFRGANFDAISTEEVSLARSWPAGGPDVVWSIEVGEGYAGAAVLNGRVYIIDYDRQKQADAIRCLSLADGADIWRYSYPVKVKRNHGMSRTVPAVTDKYVVTLGPKCHVTCLDSVTGEFYWMLDLAGEYGAKVPPWYAGQCPLIEDGKAIIAVGGDNLMMAVDCNSGEALWETANPRSLKMTHSSVIPTEFGGVRMYVYCSSGGVVGVSAQDGALLWEYADWQIRIANVPSPVIVDEGLIFLSGGYNAGSVMLELKEASGKMHAEALFRLEPEVFGADQQTPIFYEGFIYGVRPGGQLVCLDKGGRIVWTSGSGNRFGLGPYMVADGLLFVMNDSGLLTVAEAVPSRYIELAESQVLEGPESWGPMAIASGRLIIRDMNRMVCLDVTR